MANNKIQLQDGTVLMDVSGVTVTPETLASGETAMDMTGAIITGTMSGGGIAGVDLLYSNDALSISYTKTSAGTATTISGITNMCKYPFIVVIIENTNTASGSLKFVRSNTVIGNVSFASSGASVTRYGTQHYYNSGGTLTNLASTSYGLWGYTISTSNALTIRGRCNGSYYNSLTGTYKVKVLGVKL